ncbi:MAG TPA: hypothetical protein VGD88_08795 [Opitutaceae bacterium]
MGLSPPVSAPVSAGAPALASPPPAATDPRRVTVMCPGEIPKHVTEGLVPGNVLYARVTYTPE